MESSTGKSRFLRVSRFLALVGVVMGLLGCTHIVSDDYAEYLHGNKGDFRFSQTGYEARYYIAPQVRNHAYTVTSGMAGSANDWVVWFGKMLVATLESDDYRAAFKTLSETTEKTPNEGLLFKYENVGYRFTNNQAQISLQISVYRDGEWILSKTYRQDGRRQLGKMFWGGVFTMNNAIQQSTKTALDRTLSNSLSDFQAAMNKRGRLRRKQYPAADDNALAESLKELKLLNELGKLSDEEYLQKRREIINEHK